MRKERGCDERERERERERESERLWPVGSGLVEREDERERETNINEKLEI